MYTFSGRIFPKSCDAFESCLAHSDPLARKCTWLFYIHLFTGVLILQRNSWSFIHHPWEVEAREKSMKLTFVIKGSDCLCTQRPVSCLACINTFLTFENALRNSREEIMELNIGEDVVNRVCGWDVNIHAVHKYRPLVEQSWFSWFFKYQGFEIPRFFSFQLEKRRMLYGAHCTLQMAKPNHKLVDRTTQCQHKGDRDLTSATEICPKDLMQFALKSKKF